MLKRLKIQGYKSLRDIEISFEKLSVLFGPNGAGKSNVLDALQLLSRIATSRTLMEAFNPPYRGKPLESFAFGDDGIRGLLSKESCTFTIEVDVELSRGVIDKVNQHIQDVKSGKGIATLGSAPKHMALIREKNLRYRVSVQILPRSGILRMIDESLSPLTVKGAEKSRRPFLEQVGGRFHLRMEGQAHPTYYPMHLDYAVLSMPLYAPHYPHMVAMRQELASWFFFYFEPRERMREPNAVKEVRHIGLMGEELAAFLNTLKAYEPKQFKAVERALNQIVPSVTGIEVEVNNLGEVELKLMEGNTPIPARLASEGTLRILGLLALQGVKEPSALIGLEEPENGVHPRRVALIAEMLKNRSERGDSQFIVTTHSPTLLDLIPPENLYVCRKIDNATVVEPFRTWGPLGKEADIDRALNFEDQLPVSARLLRGDFDA
jgi:predicted ATPase